MTHRIATLHQEQRAALRASTLLLLALVTGCASSVAYEQESASEDEGGRVGSPSAAPKSASATPRPSRKITVSSDSMSGRGEIRGLTRERRDRIEPRSVDLPMDPSDRPDELLSAGNPEADPRAEGPRPALLAIPPTPVPTFTFVTGSGANTRIDIGGSPADANVAASTTHVCVTARAAFACYTKGGALVSLGEGFDARPYTAVDFFEESGIGTIVAYDGGGNKVKDGRVIYDHFRNRFFLVFQTREATARLLIAASRSSDPRDGWFTYADTVGTVGETAQDYQRIGVTSERLLVSNNMADFWGAGAAFTRTRHLMFSTAELTTGQPYFRADWDDPSANNAAPCDNDTNSADAYWIHRDDATHATVWGYHAGSLTDVQVSLQTSTGTVLGSQLDDGAAAGGAPMVDFGNIGRAPQNATFRLGRIVWVSNEGHTWSGQATANNAVRLVQVDVDNLFTSSSATVDIDRIFGRSASGDPAGSLFDYGWPAVATDTDGHIVVGTVRTNASIFPEMRGHVWFAGEADLSPSRSIGQGLATLRTGNPAQYHMAGASVDPTPSGGVYLAQQYPDTTRPWRIRVVKMLGENLADILPIEVQAPATVTRGTSFTVQVTVMNQGDTTSLASTGELRLSSNDFINTSDTFLSSFAIPALLHGNSVTINVPVTISASAAAGSYWIGPRLDTANVNAEYSKFNNANPFVAAGRGNVQVTVQ